MNILLCRRLIILLSVYTVIEALLLVMALSIDTFISSLAYGTNKIKIPFSSAMIINIICSVFLAISILLGEFFEPYVSNHLIKFISFILLFSLGIIKLFNKKIKNFFNHLKQIRFFSLFSDMIAIFLGSYIGIKVAKKASFNLSWLSGLILIFLAFSKL